MKNLEKLKELTLKLPDLKEITIKKTEKIAIYDVEYGKNIKGYHIYNEKDFSIQKAFIKKGSNISKHKHINKHEYLIIYDGKVLVNCEDKIKTYNENDIIYFEPNQIHNCKAIKDTWLIAIIIPEDESYPGKT